MRRRLVPELCNGHLGDLLQVAERAVRRMPGERAREPRDLVFEVLEDWYRGRIRCDGPGGKLLACLAGVIRNRARALLRRECRHGPLVEEEAVPASAPPDPLERLVTEEERAAVEARLEARLTPRQREVMALHLRGWRPADIAPRLGIAVKTVRCHLHDARRRLRRPPGAPSATGTDSHNRP